MSSKSLFSRGDTERAGLVAALFQAGKLGARVGKDGGDRALLGEGSLYCEAPMPLRRSSHEAQREE